MTDKKSIVVRDPRNTSESPYVFGSNTYPFQLKAGKDGVRNPNISKYQSFIPYTSEVDDISGKINESYEQCHKTPYNIKTPIYKTNIDVEGNKYLLFKDKEDIIFDTRNKRGILKILDQNDQVCEMFGNLQIENITKENGYVEVGIGGDVVDVKVYFNIVVILTKDASGVKYLYIGNINNKFFMKIPYFSSVANMFKDGVLYLVFDEIPSRHQLFSYDGDKLKILSRSITPIDFKEYKLLITETKFEIIGKQFNTNDILLAECLISDTNSWTVKTLKGSNLKQKILEVYKQDYDWVIVYEGVKDNKNFVGAFVVELKKIQKTIEEEISECEILKREDKEYFIDTRADDVIWVKEYRKNVVWD